ncbi:uncharacterized protein SCHCODRAFT_01214207 [Schizophyllum commune H4-8]|nr:uncharacterized protein SCHCODRAFT_01214207 [Schizophyllum commune H4-8]KAI5890150.1 hypothetical protein SCHCODRAFT_01214207 [Schizophyllum commune H4-8]
MAPDPNSPRYRVVLAFFRACEANDADTAVSLFAEPFQFRVLPKASGRPIITNRAHFRTFLQGIRGSFKTYNIEILRALDCEDNFMFFHVMVKGVSLLDTMLNNEMIFLFHFEPITGLLQGIDQYLDSASTARFFVEEKEKKDQQRSRSSLGPS